MNHPPDSVVRIEPPRPDEWTAALEHALARVPGEQRPARVQQCLQLIENGLLDPAGIWIARRGANVIATQVCVPLAGAACLFWLPTANAGLADRLVQAGLDWARSIGCKIAQALAHADELDASAPLVRQGFQPITRMHQLTHDLIDVPDEPTPLRFECIRPALHDVFAATLERTYEGSFDCPELNGTRTIDEILAGHRGQGRFHPECWWLAYEGDAPVGVLILAEMPDSMAWELAYLGVVPEHRGRRLGRAMVLHALHAVRARPATKLLLAVDERNVPARRLYQSLGFWEVESYQVLLYLFAS